MQRMGLADGLRLHSVFAALDLVLLFGISSAWQYGVSMQPTYQQYNGIVMTTQGVQFTNPPTNAAVTIWGSSTTTDGYFAQSGIFYNFENVGVAIPGSQQVPSQSWTLFWTYAVSGQYYGNTISPPSGWNYKDNIVYSISVYPNKGEFSFLFTDTSNGQTASAYTCGTGVSGEFNGNVGGLFEGLPLQAGVSYGNIQENNIGVWAQSFSTGQMNSGNARALATSDAPSSVLIDVLANNNAHVGFSQGTHYASGASLWSANQNEANQYVAKDLCSSVPPTISTTASSSTTTATSTITTSTIGAPDPPACTDTCGNSRTGTCQFYISTSNTPSLSCTTNEQFTTQFQTGQDFYQSGSTGGLQSSTANAVNSYNVANATWLLTCPMAPEANPTDQSYFYTGQVTNVAGDACINKASSVTTTMQLETDIIWGLSMFANSTVKALHIVNVGALGLKNLAYTPQIQGSPGSLSSSFSTNSYVFQQIPSIVQHGLWSWYADFADLSKAIPFSRTYSSQPQYQQTYSYNYQCGTNTCTTSYTCTYTYVYTESTSLKNIANSYIPFKEVLSPNSGGGQVQQLGNGGQVRTNGFNADILPYLLYNSSLASPQAQYLSLSYDTFSPWNYNIPANSEETFPINAPGIVYFSYNNKLGAAFEAHLQNASLINSDLMNASLGLVPFNTLTANPISITAMPNDYIFELSRPSQGGDYYLNLIRIINKGYYNTLNYTPTSQNGTLANDQGTAQQQWNNKWNGYWANVISMQDSYSYVVRSIDLSTEISSGFTPYNISSDYFGDVFITGNSSGSPQIVKLTNLTGYGNEHILRTQNLPSGVPVMQLVASSPTGALAFAATSSSGYLYVFSGLNMSFLTQVDLAFESQQSQQLTTELDISRWLAGGGLYGAQVGVQQTGQLDCSGPASWCVGQHHPLALQDTNGYIYLLDEWTAKVPQKMNILLLRVLNETGYNVPLSTVYFNDLSCISPLKPGVGLIYSCTGPLSNASLASSQFYANATYPPYGWILSANVNGTTFCSSPQCTYNPSNMPTSTYKTSIGSTATTVSLPYSDGYFPIGPAIPDTYAPLGVSFSMNYNDTLSAIFTKSNFKEVILATKVNVQNYTRLFAGNQSVTCYSDVGGSSLASTCQPLGQLGAISGPIYLVTAPAQFLASFGAMQVPTFASSVYSSLPIGAGASHSSYTLGPPSIFISQDPTDWGSAETINANASSSTNYVEIFLNSSTNPVAVGQGSAAYGLFSAAVTQASCTTLNNCLEPGTYQILAKDIATGQTTQANITINPTPQLILASPVETAENLSGSETCVQNTISAAAPYAADGVSININDPNGNSVASSSGTGTTSITIPTTGGLCSALVSGQTYKITATDTSQQGTNGVSRQLHVSGTAHGQNNLFPSAQVIRQMLNSTTQGSVLVPYEYSYSLSQSWGPQVSYAESPQAGQGPGGGPPSCPGLNFPSSTQVTRYAYNFSLINGTSNMLSSYIEGGDTYIKDILTNYYYTPELSNGNLVVPKYLLYLLQSNRLFGSVYINDTNCYGGEAGALYCSDNIQTVLNAINTTTYGTARFSEGNGQVGYELMTASNSSSQAGPNVAGKYVASSSAPGPIGFNYTPKLLSVGGVESPLFELYHIAVYNDTLNLLLNATDNYTSSNPSAQGARFNNGVFNTSGYHRLVYVMTDRFGNKIYAPISTDLVRTLTINLNVTGAVNVSNSNMTSLQINGTAVTYSNFSNKFTPLPQNSLIYLYYDSNINFVHYDPTTQSGALHSIYCAFEPLNTLLPVSGDNCTKSNPMYFGSAAPYLGNATSAKRVVGNRTSNANVINYHASYNASGTCNAPTNSLLAPENGPCNIYNGENLSATCPALGDGYMQYCMPIYANGTGICTSQLGLFNISSVKANGTFSASITSCGNRQDRILAVFYGNQPEPVAVQQVPLAQAELCVNGNCDPASEVAYELNYAQSPTGSSQSIRVGLFELSYGRLGFVALLSIILIVLAVLFVPRKQHKLRKGRQKRGRK